MKDINDLTERAKQAAVQNDTEMATVFEELTMIDMQEFKKRFVVPGNAVSKVVGSIRDSVGTLNHRKFGKNRRGTVMITGFSGDKRSDGTFEIAITFCNRRSWVDAYAFTDFRKPFRMMRVLQI